MNTFDQISYRRIQAGYWTLVVNGTDRPVVLVRQGRNWVVQAANTNRKAQLETQHGKTRRLDEAKSLANFVWFAMDSQREFARFEALEQEYRRLRELARELKVTYSLETDASTDLPRKIAIVKALIEDKYKVLHGQAI